MANIPETAFANEAKSAIPIILIMFVSIKNHFHNYQLDIIIIYITKYILFPTNILLLYIYLNSIYDFINLIIICIYT